jgi:hypothetical protein
MNLVDRVKNILFSPAVEWEKIKGETYTLSDLFLNYAMILAAIPAIAALIGFSLIGVSYGPGTFRMPLGSGIIYGILSYVSSLIGVCIAGAEAANACRRPPETQKKAMHAMRLVCRGLPDRGGTFRR